LHTNIQILQGSVATDALDKKKHKTQYRQCFTRFT